MTTDPAAASDNRKLVLTRLLDAAREKLFRLLDRTSAYRPVVCAALMDDQQGRGRPATERGQPCRHV
jgi:hypothetical protein